MILFYLTYLFTCARGTVVPLFLLLRMFLTIANSNKKLFTSTENNLCVCKILTGLFSFIFEYFAFQNSES